MFGLLTVNQRVVVYFGAELIMLFSSESEVYNYVPLGITLIYIFRFRKKIFFYDRPLP